MGPAQIVAASNRLFAPVAARFTRGRRALKGHARLSAHPSYQRLLAAEPLLKRLIPVLIVIFLAIVAATRYVQLIDMRNDREAFARQTIGLIATVLAEALRDAEASLPAGEIGAEAQVALAAALPIGALADTRRILVTDASGAIVAAVPGGPTEVGGGLGALIGDAAPLLALGERAGILEVRLADETSAFAAAREIGGRFGSVVVLAPLAAIHADWRGEVSLSASVFVGTAAVLLIILYGFYAQATRASEADRIYAETHERLDTALMRGRCGLWDWDLASGRMFWSRSMFEILGMAPRDDLLGFGEVNRLVHADDGDLLAIAEHLLRTGETNVDRMFRMRHADGRWIWLRARAELAGEAGEQHLIGIAVDTTELIRQAERNKTADIRLRDAIETISEAFVLWDARNQLVMCNSKYQQLYGLPNAAVRRGTDYDSVMAAGRKPLVRAEVTRDGPKDRGARSFEALLEDGRWLQINERTTKDGGFVSVGTDITDIKRNEERLLEGESRLKATIADLRQSRQRLEHQAQQMVELAEKYAEEKDRAEAASRAKSAFLANMGHELRTPLNAVIGFSEVMLAELFGPLGSPKYAEYCRDIHASGTYLLGVINDVLDMSRIEAGRLTLSFEALDLDELVGELLRAVAAQSSDQRIAVFADIEPGLRLEGDRRSLMQILLNLLSNAIKFTPEGGRIAVRARRSGGQAITVSIEDTGVGIPREALAKLGTPFEQLQSQDTKNHKGSGLGLAITRSLAELHGGALRIRSREGRGTLVAVRLPVRRPPGEPGAAV